MRNFLLLFLFFTFLNEVAAKPDEISVPLKFIKLDSVEFTKGILYIEEVAKELSINSLRDLESITFPKRGTYTITFIADDILKFTKLVRVRRKQNHEIVIPLKSARGNLPTTDEFETGKSFFIIHTIQPLAEDKYKDFSEMFGVGVEFKNCGIDPIEFQRARMNNKTIAKFLDKKYGSAWREKLHFKPYGI